MNIDTLKSVLEPSKRDELYKSILNFFKSLSELEDLSYQEFELVDGRIPYIKFGKDLDLKDLKCVKVFIGAQHNEYNGLFGIIEFFKKLLNNQIDINEVLLDNQILLFFPLLNPYGFLKPSIHNKSGYYLKNGSNLNRFWRNTFVPECNTDERMAKEYPQPEQTKIVYNILKEYWDDENISIYILDCHETSLLERFPRELSMELSSYYKFDHWLKEAIITNIIELNHISYYKKPLFYKCNPNADHNHVNLTYKQLDLVLEKLRVYMKDNQKKLAFYFCYSNKSKEYCPKLAQNVYDKLKSILWETITPAYRHDHEDHGCFVKMSDATSRQHVYTIELESQKQFFDLFAEIEKSEKDPDYFVNKLEIINKSIQFVIESIKEMIRIY